MNRCTDTRGHHRPMAAPTERRSIFADAANVQTRGDASLAIQFPFHPSSFYLQSLSLYPAHIWPNSRKFTPFGSPFINCEVQETMRTGLTLQSLRRIVCHKLSWLELRPRPLIAEEDEAMSSRATT